MISLPDQPIIITDSSQHTMGTSLTRYVASRTHELVDQLIYEDIQVVGVYDRTKICSCKEKCDKLENWQRPTAQINSNILRIYCYPGKDYVFHYASVIATYLSLKRNDPSKVKMTIPTSQECKEALSKSNYRLLDPTDVLIVGAGIPLLANQNIPWSDYADFQAKQERIGGCSVTWLAVKHSFWGDIAYWLGSTLADQGFRLVIFIGKLGSLNKQHKPNEVLATGYESMIDGKLVRWSNIFDDIKATNLVKGVHFTLPSVLQETVEWRKEYSTTFSFVDPEIGNFAKGVTEGGSQFSYLHIVSDNLSRKFPEDLSNERIRQVRQKRLILYEKIKEHLWHKLHSL